MSKKKYTAIGLMSGTSCDGIDASIIETDGESYIKLGVSHFIEYSKAFKSEFYKLISGDYKNLFIMENKIAEAHAKAVKDLLKKAKLKSSDIDVIGFHGQTIYHAPMDSITVQVGNAQLLANMTGIDVVYDLRKNDVVSGGQGAPLIPIFHKAIAPKKGSACFVNIGGVSNVTYINGTKLFGFDCGIGNALINDYCLQYLGKAFDEDGKVAAKGKVREDVTKKWMKDKFFKIKNAKSLDREYFKSILKDVSKLQKEDAVATLTEFTVLGIVKSINDLKPSVVYLCGGGRKNKVIFKGVSRLSNSDVKLVDELGIDGDFIESYGWGYLAVRSLKELPITFPTTTGCKAPLSGGALAKKADLITKSSR